MSYVYSVYSYRPEHFPMESLLDSPAKGIFSGTFFLIGAAGAFSNATVIYVFYHYYNYWRLTSRLWINLCIGLLWSSVALMLRSLGDHLEGMSNSELKCSLRIFVPTALDLTCLGCLSIMFIDRLTVVHFPSLYIYNEKNNNTKLLYGWFYGVCFFIFKMFIIKQNNLPDRCSTHVSLSFPLETVTLLSMATALALLLVTFQGYIFTPSVNTNLQMTWVQQEVDETIRVLMMGTCVIALWAPKHILGLMYLTYGWPEFQYQILMMLFHLPARLSLVAPLAILMRRGDFRMAFSSLRSSAEEVKELITTITEEEQQADVILRSVLLAMYPNHPELVKIASRATNVQQQQQPGSASRPSPNAPRMNTSSGASTGGGTSGSHRHRVAAISTVTFEGGESTRSEDKNSIEFKVGGNKLSGSSSGSRLT